MLLSKAGRILDKTENIFASIGGLLLLFVTFSITLEVFSRLIFNYSFLWVSEVTEYILLYIPFLGGSWLLRNDGHIVIDLIDLIKSKMLNKFIGIFVPIVGIIVCTVLVYFGFTTTIDSFQRNVTSITPLRFPMGYVYLIIPIGSLIMLFEFIRKLYNALKLGGNRS